MISLAEIRLHLYSNVACGSPLRCLSSFITLFRRLSVRSAYRKRFILIHHGSTERRSYLTIHLLHTIPASSRTTYTTRKCFCSIPEAADVLFPKTLYKRGKRGTMNYELWICKCLMETRNNRSKNTCRFLIKIYLYSLLFHALMGVLL